MKETKRKPIDQLVEEAGYIGKIKARKSWTPIPALKSYKNLYTKLTKKSKK